MRSLIVPLSLVLALPAGLYAQSVGEVAAKERERRAKLHQGKPASKVITEEDLRSGGRPRGGTISNPAATEEPAADPKAAPAPSAPGAAPAPKEKSEDELRAQRQQEWRDRMQRAQADVQTLSQRAEQLQVRVNDATGNVYSATRTNLLNELETTKTLLAAARQGLSSLEDEGRRSGYR
jgi:molecular chaperone GrpE (heat shock protein)